MGDNPLRDKFMSALCLYPNIKEMLDGRTQVERSIYETESGFLFVTKTGPPISIFCGEFDDAKMVYPDLDPSAIRVCIRTK